MFQSVRESLPAQGHVIITNNGKPTALMIDIADNNLEEVLAAVRQAQAMRALNRLQADSLRKGLDGLTERDIEAKIAAVRKERKRKIDVASGRCRQCAGFRIALTREKTGRGSASPSKDSKQR